MLPNLPGPPAQQFRSNVGWLASNEVDLSKKTDLTLFRPANHFQKAFYILVRTLNSGPENLPLPPIFQGGLQ
jgi:hypothetical protein